MGEKWFWISGAIAVTAFVCSDAATEVLKARAQTSCIAAYANSTRPIEEIKKVCNNG
jgi:hypothetical protein